VTFASCSGVLPSPLHGERNKCTYLVQREGERERETRERGFNVPLMSNRRRTCPSYTCSVTNARFSCEKTICTFISLSSNRRVISNAKDRALGLSGCCESHLRAARVHFTYGYRSNERSISLSLSLSLSREKIFVCPRSPLKRSIIPCKEN